MYTKNEGVGRTSFWDVKQLLMKVLIDSRVVITMCVAFLPQMKPPSQKTWLCPSNGYRR